jgi:hypothetical protein
LRRGRGSGQHHGVSDIHFISVSKRGVLTARRKGRAPVEVATAEEGLEIQPDRADLPRPVRVFFATGGRKQVVRVLHVTIGGEQLEVDEFLRRYGVSERDLGRWMRAMVDAALDRAEAR